MLSGHGVKAANVLPNVKRLKQNECKQRKFGMYYAAIASRVGVPIDVSVANSADDHRADIPPRSSFHSPTVLSGYRADPYGWANHPSFKAVIVLGLVARKVRAEANRVRRTLRTMARSAF